MRFPEKISTHTPLSERSQTWRWLVLHWRLESSVQIRVLGCSVTFLSNYHEVPLGFEVSLRSGYSNEMECTMVSWWSLRSFLEGNRLPKILPNQFWTLLLQDAVHALLVTTSHGRRRETSATDSPPAVCVNHATIFLVTTQPLLPSSLSPYVRPSLPALGLSLLSLGLTLSRYHIPREECKSYPSNPNPVTAELLVLTTPTLLQGHMIFSMYQT